MSLLEGWRVLEGFRELVLYAYTILLETVLNPPTVQNGTRAKHVKV